MSIIVTGAAGFVGRNLIKNFIDDVGTIYAVYNKTPLEIKYNSGNIIPIQVDLTNSEAVKNLFQIANPKFIIHLAAIANPQKENMLNNIISTYNICNNMTNKMVLHYSSSITVYGNQEYCTEKDKTEPTSVYGATKVADEALIKTFAIQRRFTYNIYRLCATVGPNLTHGLIYDMIRKLKSDSQTLELFGDYPGSIKPFIHVSDICRIIRNNLYRCSYNDTMNICNIDRLSVLDIAKLAMSCLKIQKEIVFLGNKTVWAGDNPNLSASPSYMKDSGISIINSTSAICKAIMENS